MSMRPLVYRTRCTLLALLVAQLLRAEAPPPELLGRWRSLQTSKGGIGAMLEFLSNGVVNFSSGAVVEMTYRIEGDEMIFPPATTEGPEQRQRMKFVGRDQLRLAETEMTRRGAAPDASNPILGEWLGMREMNGQQLEAHYLFYPAGKCLFLLPFLTSPGRYSIRGSAMHLELPGHQASEGSFHIEGDVLTVPSPEGSGNRFRRY